MTPDQYVVDAMRSCRPGPDFGYDLNHSLHGLASETGEIADTIKKHLVYDQPFNRENMHEELGDLMWYVALMCKACNFSLESIMIANVEKLKKRYPEKFTAEAAAARADKA